MEPRLSLWLEYFVTLSFRLFVDPPTTFLLVLRDRDRELCGLLEYFLLP